MTRTVLPPTFPSQMHRTLADAAWAASLRLPALPGAEVAIVGMLIGEARRLSDGRAVEIEELDVLADELLSAGERTGLAEVRDLHAAVVALAVELDRASAPAPRGYTPAGRRGGAGL